MCGIVGCINPTYSFGASFMKQALYVDALRGWDSTGIIRIDNGDADYYKRALPAADFIQSRVFNQLTKHVADAFIGHNRAATIGRINDETAHPFHHGDIIGVHNGTLDTGWKTALTGNFNVDSEALIANIAEEGIDATVAKAHGAFAIVYYDLNDGTVNMVRNSERPLFYGKLAKEQQPRWAFASERGTLEWIAERVDNYPLEEIHALEVGKLVTFDPENGEKWERDIKVAEKKSYTSTYYRYNNHQRSSSTTIANTTRQISTDKLKQDHAVNVGQEIEFMVTHSTTNSTNRTTATVEGYAIEEPFCKIKIYGAPDDLSFQMQYTGSVERALEVNGELQLILDSEYLIEGVEIPATNTNVIPFEEESADCKGPQGIMLTTKEFDRLTSKGCSCCGGNVYPSQSDNIVWTMTSDPICPSCVEDYGDLLSGYVQ